MIRGFCRTILLQPICLRKLLFSDLDSPKSFATLFETLVSVSAPAVPGVEKYTLSPGRSATDMILTSASLNQALGRSALVLTQTLRSQDRTKQLELHEDKAL